MIIKDLTLPGYHACAAVGAASASTRAGAATDRSAIATGEGRPASTASSRQHRQHRSPLQFHNPTPLYYHGMPSARMPHGAWRMLML